MLHLKKFLSVCLILFYASILFAKERDCMIFNLQSGAQVVVLLEQEPRIFFGEDGIYIGTDSYQFSELKNYIFGDSENLPDNIAEVISNIKFYHQNGLLYINNIPTNTDVSVYTLLGQVVNCPIEYYSDDSLVIDVNGLIPGVWLISIGNETIKFIKK